MYLYTWITVYKDLTPLGGTLGVTAAEQILQWKNI